MTPLNVNLSFLNEFMRINFSWLTIPISFKILFKDEMSLSFLNFFRLFDSSSALCLFNFPLFINSFLSSFVRLDKEVKNVTYSCCCLESVSLFLVCFNNLASVINLLIFLLPFANCFIIMSLFELFRPNSFNRVFNIVRFVSFVCSAVLFCKMTASRLIDSTLALLFSKRFIKSFLFF